MTPSEANEAIKKMFNKTGNPANVSLLNGESIKAELLEDGIKVFSPENEDLIPWSAFVEVLDILVKGRGDGSDRRSRNAGFYITDINGVPAYVVYGAQLKHSIYGKIAPVIAILIEAEICRYESGYLVLTE